MQRLDISQWRIGVMCGDRERIYSMPVAGQGRAGAMASPGDQQMGGLAMGWRGWAVEDGGVEDVQR
ncbi:hypothetical protein C3Y05_013425 [Aeromonas allosaccharophila]|uniref:hypothetical protein n=1 Tax=Aeromonas allosaccharophila TaxID=656 RepID=UPI0013CC979B|nr:hypothetical protein [Aeromonas allosaccharophila]WDO00673.1 hypothetical protein C3Y05_013425 [Aeromonas allosaccharophila]